MSAAGGGERPSDPMPGPVPLAKLLMSTSPNPVKAILAAAGSDGAGADAAAPSVDLSSLLSINLAR